MGYQEALCFTKERLSPSAFFDHHVDQVNPVNAPEYIEPVESDFGYLFIPYKFPQKYCGRYYAKAQNLVPGLTQAYDDALKEVDMQEFTLNKLDPKKSIT